jgi:hypothetical protein
MLAFDIASLFFNEKVRGQDNPSAWNFTNGINEFS